MNEQLKSTKKGECREVRDLRCNRLREAECKLHQSGVGTKHTKEEVGRLAGKQLCMCGMAQLLC